MGRSRREELGRRFGRRRRRRLRPGRGREGISDWGCLTGRVVAAEVGDIAEAGLEALAIWVVGFVAGAPVAKVVEEGNALELSFETLGLEVELDDGFEVSH